MKKIQFVEPNVFILLNGSIYVYHSVTKISELFFCKHLVDFSEARLHVATLNLQTHA